MFPCYSQCAKLSLFSPQFVKLLLESLFGSLTSTHTRTTTTMLLLWTLACMAAVAPILLWQALWVRLSAVLTPFSLWSSYIRRQRSTTQQACASRHSGHLEELPPATPAQVAALIQSRRSIFPKSMTGATVSRDSIMAMLQAANWAPTHGRTEPWRFVVLGQAGMQAMQLLTEDIFRCQLADQPVLLQVRGTSEAVIYPCHTASGAQQPIMPCQRLGAADHIIHSLLQRCLMLLLQPVLL